MPFPLIAAVTGVASVAGALINNKSNKSTNKANAKSVANTNAANAAEAERNRQFNRQLSRDAFARDQQALDKARRLDNLAIGETRKYEKAQTLETEARGRAYLAEDRAYNDPAATRARLEAAGYNPATMSDPSNAVVGSGAFSVASSQIAQARAAVSNVAFSQPHQNIAFQATPSTFGTDLANAAIATSNAYAQDQEIALRQSQVALENARLSQVMQRASMTPIVNGPYGGRNAPAQNTSPSVPSVSGSGNDAGDFSSPNFVGPRQLEVNPSMNDSGVLTVQNDVTGPFHVPAIDGEPIDIGQALVMAPFAIPQIIANKWRPIAGAHDGNRRREIDLDSFSSVGARPQRTISRPNQYGLPMIVPGNQRPLSGRTFQ